MLSLVVARARNGAIGKDGGIPWHIPADLAFFKRETLGGAIIMGRRTWESLPRQPLPSRLNLVVSRSLDLPGTAHADVDSAIAAAHEAGHARIYGIGGARIYQEMLPQSDRLLITEVDTVIPDADTFFPDFDEAEWAETLRRPLPSEGPGCVLRELLRRR